MNRLVFVTQVFYPDSQITGVLLARLAVGLRRHGFECRTLSGFPVAEREKQGAPVPSRERWEGVKIVRGGPRINAKAGMVQRGWSYAGFLLWLAGQLMFSWAADERVIVVTNPPFAPLVVALMARLRGRRFVVLIHDVYPEGLVALGVLRRGALAKLWHAANRFVYAGAECTIVLGRDMRALLIRSYGVPAGRIAVVPNWNPHPRRSAALPEETRLWQNLGLPRGSFVVQYSGNMGLWHDIDAIVYAAHRLLDLPELQFMMIGGGRRMAAAAALAEKIGCTNIRWLPFQPVENLADSLACCHVALISQRAGLEGIAVPSKLYGVLSSGRAVIAQVPAGSEVAAVVNEAKCGWVVPPDDAEALARSIRHACSNPSETAAAGQRAVLAYETCYEEGHALGRLASALNNARALS